MNRIVHAHIKSLAPQDIEPDEPVFWVAARAHERFRELCQLAGIRPKTDIETGKEVPWVLKDFHKTCATYHDELPTFERQVNFNRRLMKTGIG